MIPDDDLRALADIGVDRPPFADVTRRAARRRRRRVAAAGVSVVVLAGAGIGLSVSRGQGDDDIVATAPSGDNEPVDDVESDRVEESGSEPDEVTPVRPDATVPAVSLPDPTVVPTTSPATCSGAPVEGETIGIADVDGDGMPDELIAGDGRGDAPIVVAHNPATFGWSEWAELQGWAGTRVVAAAALDERPGQEVFIGVGGNAAWNAALVTMVGCELGAITAAGTDGLFLVLIGATGNSCAPSGCAVRVRCAEGVVVTEQARPGTNPGEFDWSRVSYRIADSVAVEVSNDAGTATSDQMPFPLDQTMHCPVPVPALPAAWLGITISGEVVDVSTDDGIVARSYGGLGDPTAPLPPEAESAPDHADGAWRLGSSPVLYVSVCCEPAGGSVIRTTGDLADRQDAYSGFVAVPSPDGLATAFAGLADARVLPTGSNRRSIEISAPAPAATLHTTPGGISWLRDRRGVVWASSYGGARSEVRVIELDEQYRPVSERTLPGFGLHSVTVAARGDGAIVIAGCVELDVGRPCPSSRAWVVDPDTGETIDEFTVAPGTLLGGYDPSGTFLIHVDGAGTVRWRSETGDGLIAEGYRWATW